MSLEAWSDEDWEADPVFDEARVEEAFRDGLRVCREYMARFVEQGGDSQTAASIRANWNPAWGPDAGQMTGELWIDPWAMTSELYARCSANTERILAEAYRDSDEHRNGEDPKGLSGEAMPARAVEDGIAQPAPTPTPSQDS